MLKDFFKKIKDLDKKKRLRYILIVSFLVLIILLLSIFFYIIPNGKYKEGLRLIDEKKYDNAISLFYDLGDFKDSKEKVFEATVLKAFSLYDKGDYEGSINLLKTIGAEEEVYERIYKMALGYYNRKDFDRSNPFFILLGDYKDSKSRIHYHNFNELNRKEATCVNDGYIEYYCEGCDSTYTEKLKKTGEHDFIIVEKLDATCLEGGLVKYQCSMCKKKSSSKISALGHDYIEESKDATCTKKGKVKKVCSRCGDTIEEEIDKLGHDYKIISDTSTCLEDGIVTYECTRCKKQKEEIKVATGHDMEDATCDLPSHCKKCDYTEGEPLGHTTKRGKCDRCNKEIYFYDYVTFTISNDIPVQFTKTIDDSILEIVSYEIKEAYNDSGIRVQDKFVLSIKYNYTFGSLAIDKIKINLKDSYGNEDNFTEDIWCLGNVIEKEKVITLPLLGYDEEIDSNSYIITLSID